MKHLKQIYLEMSFESVNSDLLDPRMFYKVESLVLNRNVMNIESGLFKKFKFLRFVLICKNLYILNDTFEKSADTSNMSLDLLKNNFKIIFILQLGFIEETSFTRIYEFPDEDLCLFKDFPHAQLVLPIILQKEPLKCTCTLKWLEIQFKMYGSFLRLTKDY